MSLLLSLSQNGKEKISEIEDHPNLPDDIREVIEACYVNKGQMKLTEVILLAEWMVLQCKNTDGASNFHVSDLVKNASLILPQFEPPPKNPELVQRLKHLQAAQDNKDYNKMVSNVHQDRKQNVSTKSPFTTGLNFAVTFIASVFATSYVLKLIIPSLAARMAIGVVVGTILLIIEIILALRGIEKDVIKSKQQIQSKKISKRLLTKKKND